MFFFNEHGSYSNDRNFGIFTPSTSVLILCDDTQKFCLSLRGNMSSISTNFKCISEPLINMSLLYRWNCLVQESGGTLPATLKPFQLDTVSLLAAGKSVLAAVPTGRGKTLIQLHGSRVIGGETLSFCHLIL